MSEPLDNQRDSPQLSHEGKPLPEFTLKNVILDIFNGIYALFTDPFVNRIIIPVIIALSSVFTKVIIAKVPYTEIDFKTYMQQIEVVNDGEIDYNLIKGDTGPCVYPAGFIQIYEWIYWLTDSGSDIVTGQKLFGYLFTISVVLCCTVYTMVPNLKPWPLYLLLLSKRLYSIYVLRLFNDCFTTICMISVTLLLQQASYWYSTSGSLIPFLLCIVASDLYSIAISIKMNALLYFPGFVIISFFLVGENPFKLILVLLVIPFIQITIGWKFLLPLFNDEEAIYIRWNYINQAFDFKRNFLYEWTVNWRFLSEDFFLSDKFSTLLLVGNVTVLLFFIFTRFINKRITGKSIGELIKNSLLNPFKSTISPNNLFINYESGPKLILLIMSCSNFIGILFARSLHYQFLSWYCWQLPFLIYATNINFVGGILIFLVHEWCWNVFPSTEASSLTLVGIISSILIAVWRNERIWFNFDDDKQLKEKKIQ